MDLTGANFMVRTHGATCRVRTFIARRSLLDGHYSTVMLDLHCERSFQHHACEKSVRARVCRIRRKKVVQEIGNESQTGFEFAGLHQTRNLLQVVAASAHPCCEAHDFFS
jgi:hypothetical protein